MQEQQLAQQLARASQGSRMSDKDVEYNQKLLDTNNDGMINEQDLEMLNKELGAGGLIKILNLFKRIFPGMNAKDTESAQGNEGLDAMLSQGAQEGSRPSDADLQALQMQARAKLLGGSRPSDADLRGMQ